MICEGYAPVSNSNVPGPDLPGKPLFPPKCLAAEPLCEGVANKSSRANTGGTTCPTEMSSLQVNNEMTECSRTATHADLIGTSLGNIVLTLAVLTSILVGVTLGK